jgi:hypothetical protein
MEYRPITAKEAELANVLELAGYPADEAADLNGMQYRQANVSAAGGGHWIQPSVCVAVVTACSAAWDTSTRYAAWKGHGHSYCPFIAC